MTVVTADLIHEGAKTQGVRLFVCRREGPGLPNSSESSSGKLQYPHDAHSMNIGPFALKRIPMLFSAAGTQDAWDIKCCVSKAYFVIQVMASKAPLPSISRALPYQRWTRTYSGRNVPIKPTQCAFQKSCINKTNCMNVYCKTKQNKISNKGDIAKIQVLGCE